MNYIYKGKLYTIRKIDIKDFQQYEGKWYPTVFYENEGGLKFNRSAKEFFDKFELYKEYTREEYGNECLIYGKCDICGLKKDLEKNIINNVIIEHCESCDAEKYYKEINKLEPILYSTPKSGKSPKVDLISLVLEKMPFLDSEEFEILNNNDGVGGPHITVNKINSPLEEWHIYRNDIDRDLQGLKKYFNLD